MTRSDPLRRLPGFYLLLSAESRHRYRWYWTHRTLSDAGRTLGKAFGHASTSSVVKGVDVQGGPLPAEGINSEHSGQAHGISVVPFPKTTRKVWQT